MRVKLFNIKQTMNGNDRVLYTSKNDREAQFNDLTSLIKECSNFERVDDMTFNIDIYKLSSLLYNYIIFQSADR